MGLTPTAACALIVRADGRVLSVSRRGASTDRGLPGGKIEPGEDPRSAAKRELFEESGVTALGELREVYVGPAGQHVAITYQVDRFNGTPVAAEDGVVDWVEWPELCSGSFGDYNRALWSALEHE